MTVSTCWGEKYSHVMGAVFWASSVQIIAIFKIIF